MTFFSGDLGDFSETTVFFVRYWQCGEKKCIFADSKTSDMENNSAYWLDMSVTTFNIEARYQKYKEE